MKKAKVRAPDDEMLPEYDFSGAVRGKYYQRYHRSSNVVVLAPDVSEVFPNAASVNAALRSLASVARRSVAKPSRSARRPNKRTQRTRSATGRRRGPRR